MARSKKQLPVQPGVDRAQLAREELERREREELEQAEIARAENERVAEVAARQLSQSVMRQYGAYPRQSELGTDVQGLTSYHDQAERSRSAMDAMAADGIGAMEVRTLARQHTADLQVATQQALDQRQATDASQLAYMASSHDRTVNAWEREQIAQGRLQDNPYLPDEASDLAQVEDELETLRQGVSLADGMQIAGPNAMTMTVSPPAGAAARAVSEASSAQMQGSPRKGISQQVDQPAPEQAADRAVPGVSSQAGLAAVRVRLGGPAAGADQVDRLDELGPKARARLEKHPELADAIQTGKNPVERLDERTQAWSQPEADQGLDNDR